MPPSDNPKEFRISAGQLILPVSLIAFVVFLILAFQTSQLWRERDALHDAHAQQDKPLEEAQKVQAQLQALAVGTKKLADQGDKNAQTIIDRMKDAGITVSGAAPMPAAQPSPGTPANAPSDSLPPKAAPQPGE